MLAAVARVAAPYAIALAIGLSAGWWATNNHWSAKYDKRSVEYAEATTRAEQAARATESMWRSRSDAIRDSTQQEIQRLSANVARSDRAADGLREQVERLASRPAKCPATPDGSPAIDPDKGVLAELYGVFDELAGKYAKEADGSRIAGEACEAAADSLITR